MKIALLNDTHFGTRGDSQVFLDHQEKFFKEIFFPYIDENEIKTVFHLGDTFDRRKYINFLTLKRSKEFFFDEISKRNIDYHMILGNHDIFYTNTNEINSVKLLINNYPNFNIYETEAKELDFGSSKILFCPWITKTNEENILNSINNSTANIVLGHFAIVGFEMLKGSICDHGLEKNVFSRFEAVYSGHFHHPSEYNNIKYLGAQYEMVWSDYGEKRGFHVFDTETRDLKFIENTFKIFHKIEYDDTDLSIEDIKELDTSILKDTYIKIIVKNRNNPYIFDLFLNKINDSSPADVKTIEDSLNLEGSGVNEILDESKDTKEILKDYVYSLDTEIEKEKIIKILENLYLEALSI